MKLDSAFKYLAVCAKQLSQIKQIKKKTEDLLLFLKLMKSPILYFQ